MTIKIKIDDLEIFTEKFTIQNGVLRCEKFVGVNKMNVGEGLTIFIENKRVEITSIEEPFSKIENDTWNNICKTNVVEN